MTTDAHDALGLSADELDRLFEKSEAGAIPRGRGAGTALAGTASQFARPFAKVASVFWQGKRFEALHDELRNLITRAELPAFRARVREEPSLVDGRPCIVLDYSKTSWLARPIRDEIRQVAPGEFLGIVFVFGRRVPLRFWLHFSTAA
jgi:hypothetical protein